MTIDQKNDAKVKMFIIHNEKPLRSEQKVLTLKISEVEGKVSKNGQTFTTECRRETNYRTRLTVWTPAHGPRFAVFCFEREEQAKEVLKAHLTEQIAEAQEIVKSFSSQLDALIKATSRQPQEA